MSNIICGNCTKTHHSVNMVKACYADRVFPCHWLVEDFNEDGRIHVDCGADAVFSETGWSCEAGHQHVTMEARHAEGWDYVEEWGEALDLAMAGVEPRTMSGHLVLHPSNFAA